MIFFISTYEKDPPVLTTLEKFPVEEDEDEDEDEDKDDNKEISNEPDIGFSQLEGKNEDSTIESLIPGNSPLQNGVNSDDPSDQSLHLNKSCHADFSNYFDGKVLRSIFSWLVEQQQLLFRQLTIMQKQLKFIFKYTKKHFFY